MPSGAARRCAHRARASTASCSWIRRRLATGYPCLPSAPQRSRCGSRRVRCSGGRWPQRRRSNTPDDGFTVAMGLFHHLDQRPCALSHWTATCGHGIGMRGPPSRRSATRSAAAMRRWGRWCCATSARGVRVGHWAFCRRHSGSCFPIRTETKEAQGVLLRIVRPRTD